MKLHFYSHKPKKILVSPLITNTNGSNCVFFVLEVSLQAFIYYETLEFGSINYTNNFNSNLVR